MQDRDLLDLSELGLAEAEAPGDRCGQLDHALGVLAGVVVAGLERRDERCDTGELDLGGALARLDRVALERLGDEASEEAEQLAVARGQLRLRVVAEAAEQAEQITVAADEGSADVGADSERFR